MESKKIPANLGDNVDDEDDSIEDYLGNVIFDVGENMPNLVSDFCSINLEKKRSLFKQRCRSPSVKIKDF